MTQARNTARHRSPTHPWVCVKEPDMVGRESAESPIPPPDLQLFGGAPGSLGTSATVVGLLRDCRSDPTSVQARAGDEVAGEADGPLTQLVGVHRRCRHDSTLPWIQARYETGDGSVGLRQATPRSEDLLRSSRTRCHQLLAGYSWMRPSPPPCAWSHRQTPPAGPPMPAAPSPSTGTNSAVRSGGGSSGRCAGRAWVGGCRRCRAAGRRAAAVRARAPAAPSSRRRRSARPPTTSPPGS